MPLAIDGISFDVLTSDPSTPAEGQVWYNTTTKRLRGHFDGINRTLVHNFPANSSLISVERIGSATYEDTQEIHNVTRSAGHIDGGEITDAGGGSINVAAGQGFIRAVNDDVSTLFAFDWPAPSSIAIPDNSIRYVRVDYNAGSPAVTVSVSEDYDYRTGFPLGFVVREGGVLYINETPHSAGRGVGRLSRRNYEVDGRSRAHQLGGLIISQSATVRTLAITAGVTWLRGIRSTFAAFDSNASNTFDRYYRDGVGGWTREAAQTQAPAGLWDDGDGTPATIGNNNFVNYWFYLGPGGGIALVYGRADHNSLSAANAGQPPGDLPLRLQVGSIFLGRFIVQRTGGTFPVVQVDSAFDAQFTPTPISDHGALAGLADDDHPQYLLANGTRSLSGNLDMGANAIVNVGDVDGVDVSARSPTTDEKSALAGTSGAPSGANRYVTDTDARNTNSRTPTGAASGQLGGTYPGPDVRGLRETGGPTLMTLGGIADGEFLRRVGSTVVGASPGAGSTDIKQTEIDFGATPVFEKEFTITDAGVSPASQIKAQIAYEAPTGRDLDEVEMEPFDVRCGPGAGQFKVHAVALEGPVRGLYKLNYLIG